MLSAVPEEGGICSEAELQPIPVHVQGILH